MPSTLIRIWNPVDQRLAFVQLPSKIVSASKDREDCWARDAAMIVKRIFKNRIDAAAHRQMDAPFFHSYPVRGFFTSSLVLDRLVPSSSMLARSLGSSILCMSNDAVWYNHRFFLDIRLEQLGYTIQD